MSYKSATECACVHREKTLFANSLLSLQKESDKYDYAPLMTFDHFSRYQFVLINEDKKMAKDNLDVTAIRSLIRKTKIAFENDFLNQPSDSSLPEYATLKLVMGANKGKTPAQVLSEKGETGVEELTATAEYLKMSSIKNPKFKKNNEHTINVLREAVVAFRNGSLDSSSVSSVAPLKLHEALVRVNSYKPTVINNHTVYPVRSTSIMWNPGLKNPVSIHMVNFLAPMNKLSNGLTVADASHKIQDSVVDITMNLSADEFMNFIADIEDDLNRFKLLNAKTSIANATALAKILCEEN
jgi:hypothetical protein